MNVRVHVVCMRVPIFNMLPMLSYHHHPVCVAEVQYSLDVTIVLSRLTLGLYLPTLFQVSSLQNTNFLHTATSDDGLPTVASGVRACACFMCGPLRAVRHESARGARIGLPPFVGAFCPAPQLAVRAQPQRVVPRLDRKAPRAIRFIVVVEAAPAIKVGHGGGCFWLRVGKAC